jgi:hypothetical protein
MGKILVGAIYGEKYWSVQYMGKILVVAIYGEIIGRCNIRGKILVGAIHGKKYWSVQYKGKNIGRCNIWGKILPAILETAYVIFTPKGKPCDW